MSGKQLELLREAVPGIARVAVLWDPATPPFRCAPQVAAQLLGVTLHTLEVGSLDEFIGAFDSVRHMPKLRVVVTALVSSPCPHRRPGGAAPVASHRHVQGICPGGALMSYGPNLEEMARHVATTSIAF